MLLISSELEKSVVFVSFLYLSLQESKLKREASHVTSLQNKYATNDLKFNIYDEQ